MRTPLRKRTIYPAVAFLLLCSACSNEHAVVSPAQLAATVAQASSKHQWRTAIVELKDFLRNHPKDFSARMLLGDVYATVGLPNAARGEYEHAANIDPNAEPAQLGLLRAMVAMDDVDAAAKRLAKIGGPTSFDRQVVNATILTGADKLDDAAALLDKLMTTNAESIELRLALSRFDLRAGKLAEADQHIAWLQGKNADDPRVGMAAGELRLLQNRPGDAVDEFMKVAAIVPNHPMANYGQARAGVQADRLDDADKAATRLRQQSPGSPTVNFIDGYIEFARQNYKLAKDKLALVLKFAPTHPQSRMLMAQIMLLDQQYEQAAAYLESLNASFPDDAKIIRMLAVARIQGHEPQKAVTALEPLAETSKSPEDLALLGSAYLKSGDLARGYDLLKQAVAAAPGDSALVSRLGATELALGHNASAVANLERGRAGRQPPADEYLMLVYAYLRTGELAKAEAVTRELTRRHPQDTLGYNLAGGVQLALKNSAAARTEFQHALDIDPDFVPALLNVANIDLQAGDIKSARAGFAHVLKINPATANALVGMGRLAFAENDAPAARKFLEHAYAINPADDATAIMLGQVMLDLRMAEKALPILESVVPRARNERATTSTSPRCLPARIS